MTRRPVRVIIAARLFPPEPGAASFRLGSLARSLTTGPGATPSTEVEVFTTRPPRTVRGRTWSAPGMRVRRWPVLRDAGGNVRGYVQFASFDGPLLLRLLLARRPDVIVVEPPPTTGAVVRLVSRARHIPYVYYAADVSSTAAAGIGIHPRAVAVLRRLESWVLTGADRVLAVSDGVAGEVVGLGVDAARVEMVGTGVDTDTFHSATGHLLEGQPEGQAGGQAGGQPEGRPTLVYAGTMSEIHGAEVFVRGFAQVATEFPDARLVMLGQGTERDQLQALAEELAPGRVRFEGLVAAERVRELMQKAWAGLASVRPGRGYDFAFPTKMFVATACGTPVIYAGVGPGRAILESSELGWGVDWDADQVAKAMREALSRPPDRTWRVELEQWTRAHASQSRSAQLATDAVLGVAPRVTDCPI